MKLFLCVLVPLLCPRLSHGSTLLEAVREAVQMMEVPSDYWAVQVHGGASKATQLAHKHRLQLLGTIGNLADYYHLKLLPIANTANSVSGGGSGLSVLLEQEQEVGYVKQQSVRGMSSRQYSPSPTDPLWPQQWSLMSGGGLQVESVWRDGITGDSVVVAIVDDGLERTHPDLTDNYDPAASYDYVDYDLDPSPKGEDHGTSCAGIIAMARDNSRCGVGVAYNCSIGGVRINVSSISDALEASALGHHNSYVDVYSASWGPPDVGFWVSGPGPLTTNTLKASVHYGRSGKGSVYVWASGNGGAYYDSCAADGYASSIYTIAVGSVNRDGTPANYDEQCAAKMAVTFSHSKDNQQVVSSSGNGGCTDSFTGTSAATPLAAGVIALTLQANPQLTWRDIQHLLALTANTTSLTDGDWTTNGRGINVSHKFGFGAVDAVAMVTSARTWTNVPEQLSQIIYSSTRTRIARYSSPLCLTFEVFPSSIVYLEHVVLTVSLSLRDVGRVYSVTDLPLMSNHSSLVSWLTHSHPRRGDIKLDLTSPSGTLSHLLPYRQYDFINQHGYTNWPFMSVQHWGENPIGQWNLSVTFKSSSGFVSVRGVRLKLYGIQETSIPPPSTQHISSHLPTQHTCTSSHPPTQHTSLHPLTQHTSSHPLTQHTSSHPLTQHTSSHPLTQHTSTTPTIPPLKYILPGSVGGMCILIGVLLCIIIYCSCKRSTPSAHWDTTTLL